MNDRIFMHSVSRESKQTWSLLIIRQFLSIHLCWGSAPVMVLHHCAKIHYCFGKTCSVVTLYLFCIRPTLQFALCLGIKQDKNITLLTLPCKHNTCCNSELNTAKLLFWTVFNVLWTKLMRTVVLTWIWHFWQIYYMTSILFERNNPWRNINIPKKHRFSFSKVFVLMPYLRQLTFWNKIMCEIWIWNKLK